MDYKGLDIIKAELDILDDFIIRSIGSPQPLIASTVRELASAGGKRIRPALTILVGKALGHQNKNLIPIAASMEIIHMSTLVHDDIVDDAQIRRGIPTVQSKYGKDIAVFTGDYLFSKAFLIIAQYADKNRLSGFAHAVKRICEGEIEQYENRFSLDVSLLKYLRRIRRKTGILLALSCAAGIGTSKVDRKIARSLVRYGIYLGLAFQITDDILDYTGDSMLIGKPVGNDVGQGIYTLPLIYAINHYEDKDELIRNLKTDSYGRVNIGKIMSIVNSCGGIDFSQKLVERYIRKGIESIEPLKDSRYKDALKDLIKSISNRQY